MTKIEEKVQRIGEMLVLLDDPKYRLEQILNETNSGLEYEEAVSAVDERIGEEKIALGIKKQKLEASLEE